jgi:hypothetical protein
MFVRVPKGLTIDLSPSLVHVYSSLPVALRSMLHPLDHNQAGKERQDHVNQAGKWGRIDNSRAQQVCGACVAHLFPRTGYVPVGSTAAGGRGGWAGVALGIPQQCVYMPVGSLRGAHLLLPVQLGVRGLSCPGVRVCQSAV